MALFRFHSFYFSIRKWWNEIAFHYKRLRPTMIIFDLRYRRAEHGRYNDTCPLFRMSVQCNSLCTWLSPYTRGLKRSISVSKIINFRSPSHLCEIVAPRVTTTKRIWAWASHKIHFNNDCPERSSRYRDTLSCSSKTERRAHTSTANNNNKLQWILNSNVNNISVFSLKVERTLCIWGFIDELRWDETQCAALYDSFCQFTHGIWSMHNRFAKRSDQIHSFCWHSVLRWRDTRSTPMPAWATCIWNRHEWN